MIVSHARRYVFIAVPKNASTSIRHLLLSRCQGEQVGHDHACRVPEECREYFTFAVVRDPYDRFWSLYGYICHRPEHRCHELALELGPDGFAHWLADPSLEPIIPPSAYEMACGISPDGFTGRDGCQSDFVRHLPDVCLLRYEYLSEGLRALPFVGFEAENLPRRNRGDAGERHMTPAMAEAIYRWAREDFERFGYPRRKL